MPNYVNESNEVQNPFWRLKVYTLPQSVYRTHALLLVIR